MKCVDGIWLPDRETAIVDIMKRSPKIDGKGTFQYDKLTAALKHVKKWRCALDIGMHVGVWAMHLAKRFDRVVGFEPVPEHIDCLRLNMKDFKNYEVHNCALGRAAATVGLGYLPGSTGSTYIKPDGEGVSMVTLDSFEIDIVDFIKIDVEGYEYMVLEGGEKTIRRNKPVIILEQKPGKVEWFGHKQHDAKELLEAWGAKFKFVIAGDCCLAW